MFADSTTVTFPGNVSEIAAEIYGFTPASKEEVRQLQTSQMEMNQMLVTLEQTINALAQRMNQPTSSVHTCPLHMPLELSTSGCWPWQASFILSLLPHRNIHRLPTCKCHESGARHVDECCPAAACRKGS